MYMHHGGLYTYNQTFRFTDYILVNWLYNLTVHLVDWSSILATVITWSRIKVGETQLILYDLLIFFCEV